MTITVNAGGNSYNFPDGTAAETIHGVISQHLAPHPQSGYNPSSGVSSDPGSVFSDRGMFGKIDQGIDTLGNTFGMQGPGNTTRKMIADVGRMSATMNPAGAQMQAQMAADKRPLSERSTDTLAGVAGLAGVTGDTLRTLGAPGWAGSLDAAQQSFQQHNAPQLGVLGEIGRAAGGLAPEVAHDLPPSVRVPTLTSAAGRLSADLPSAMEVANNPAMQGARDLANAARRDRIDPLQRYREMTPQAEPAGHAAAVPQHMVDQIIDHHGEMEPNQIAAKLGVDPAVVKHYTDRFNAEKEPVYGGQNLYETLRTDMNGKTVWAPNLRRQAYEAANTDNEGSSILQNGLAQRRAEANDAIAKIIDDTAGSHNFDRQLSDLQRGHKSDADYRYKDLFAKNPDLLFAKYEFGKIAGVRDLESVFNKAAHSTQADAALRGELFDPEGELFTPRQLNTLQSQLRIIGEGKGDTLEARNAMKLRKHITDVADAKIEKFANVRGWFRNAKETEEAALAGRKLGLTRGHSGTDEWQTFRKNLVDERVKQNQLQRLNSKRGGGLLARTAPPWNTKRAQDLVERKQTELTHASKKVDWYRKSFGQGMKDLLGKGEFADTFLNAAKKQQARERMMEAFGPEKGRSFVNQIEAQLRKQATSRDVYGNSETHARQQHSERAKAAGDLALSVAALSPHGVLTNIGKIARNRYHEQRTNAINVASSHFDAAHVRRLLRFVSSHADHTRPKPSTGKAIGVNKAKINAAGQAVRAMGGFGSR